MKCDSVQALLPRYLTRELRESQRSALERHVADCAVCREALAFERSLELRLDSDVAPPDRLRATVSDRIAEQRPARLALLTRFLGDSTMKKLFVSSTLVTALAIAVLTMGPRTASASTPEEALRSMRAALAHAANTGELALSLTANEAGSVTIAGTLNGQPLPPGFPLRADVTREGDILDVVVTVDLAPESYSAVTFGEDGSLMLTPKAKQDEKYAVALDPISRKPTSWTTLAKERGDWKVKSRSDFKPKPAAPPAKDDDTLIQVRVRMLLNQSASITSEPGK